MIPETAVRRRGSRPRWVRLASYLTVASLAVAGCTGGDKNETAALTADALKSAMAVVSEDLPADPGLAAEALVAQIIDGVPGRPRRQRPSCCAAPGCPSCR